MTPESPQSANNALANGLFMCQKKVYAEKCKREPLHCLKCHGWNHLASTCPQQFDFCGTCAQRHCTADCSRLDNPRCISCGCNGHASWDRGCPTFLQKCTELNKRAEDNSMPYFPTLETWTQAKEPANPA